MSRKGLGRLGVGVHPREPTLIWSKSSVQVSGVRHIPVSPWLLGACAGNDQQGAPGANKREAGRAPAFPRAASWQAHSLEGEPSTPQIYCQGLASPFPHSARLPWVLPPLDQASCPLPEPLLVRQQVDGYGLASECPQIAGDKGGFAWTAVAALRGRA